MQKWEMVEMENDYIKLWIMPGVGGKIWGAVDKRTDANSSTSTMW